MLKVSQQYFRIHKVVESCETSKHLSGMRDWIQSIYRNWKIELITMNEDFSVSKATRYMDEFEKITDYMFKELGDIIDKKEKEAKKVVVHGFR